MIPSWIKWLAAAAAALALVWAAGRMVGAYNEARRAEGATAERAKWLLRDQLAAEASAKETLRRLERQAEIDRAHQAKLAALEANLRSARATSDGLRGDLARFTAAARAERCPDPGAEPSGEGERDSSALDLLAGLLARVDDSGRELAQYADRLRIAGERCEAEYEALTAAP